MTTTLPEIPGLGEVREPRNLAAWHYAQELCARSQELSQMMQPVFRSWLKAQSGAALLDCTPGEIFLWLSTLPPGQAESEYRLALMEISWLEMLTGSFFFFLSRDTQ